MVKYRQFGELGWKQCDHDSIRVLIFGGDDTMDGVYMRKRGFWYIQYTEILHRDSVLGLAGLAFGHVELPQQNSLLLIRQLLKSLQIS